MSKCKEGDLPHLLTFLQDSVATRQRALCASTSTTKATSKPSSESTLQERLPTASALAVSEHIYSYSDAHGRCFTCAKKHILVSCEQFLKFSVAKRRQAIYNYDACYKCFKVNHLAKNCPIKINCHYCDAPHHPLFCSGVHGSDETNTSKFNNNPSFTGEHRCLGLVHRGHNKAVKVSRAPPNPYSGVPNSVSRLNSLVKNEEKNNSVDNMNPSVPSNYIRDSVQERL